MNNSHVTLLSTVISFFYSSYHVGSKVTSLSFKPQKAIQKIFKRSYFHLGRDNYC